MPPATTSTSSSNKQKVLPPPFDDLEIYHKFSNKDATAGIDRIVFSDCGNFLATCDSSDIVVWLLPDPSHRAWDFSSQNSRFKKLHVYNMSKTGINDHSSGKNIKFSHDSTLLSVPDFAGGDVIIFLKGTSGFAKKFEPKKPIHTQGAGSFECVSWSYDNNKIATCFGNNMCRIWNVKAGTVRADFSVGFTATCCVYSPRDMLAVGDNAGKISLFSTSSTKGYDRLCIVTHATNKMIHDISFSSNGKFFASAASSGQVICWSIINDDTSCTQRSYSNNHTDCAIGVQISPADSLTVMSISQAPSNAILFSSSTSGELLKNFALTSQSFDIYDQKEYSELLEQQPERMAGISMYSNKFQPSCAAFSRNSRFVFVGSCTNEIRVIENPVLGELKWKKRKCILKIYYEGGTSMKMALQVFFVLQTAATFLPWW